MFGDKMLYIQSIIDKDNRNYGPLDSYYMTY